MLKFDIITLNEILVTLNIKIDISILNKISNTLISVLKNSKSQINYPMCKLIQKKRNTSWKNIKFTIFIHEMKWRSY